MFHISNHIAQHMERLIVYFISVSVTRAVLSTEGEKDLNAGLGLI